MSKRLLSFDGEVKTFDPRTPREIWLVGDSAMCACPDCGAPMTIRLWLRMADCWKCGCSVELTAQQERQIQNLLRQSRREPNSETRFATATPASQDNQPVLNRQKPPATKAPPKRPDWNRQPTSQKLGTKPKHNTPVPMRLRPSTKPKSVRDWVSQMPAWLISLLLHLALLILLALLFFEADSRLEDYYITLSTEVNEMNWMGGETRFDESQDAVQFDMPIPDSATPQQRTVIAKANQDARELRIDPSASTPQLPSLKQVKQTLRSGSPTQRTFSARDPRVRAQIVTAEGGTTLTEAAVARGLRWLAQHQNENGSWSLHRFHRTESCGGRCRGTGSINCDSAGTSLCLLPFLGAGQTHQTGIYQQNVAKGLRWLIQNQRPNGDLRNGVNNNAGMYAHGQGAIVLCEAFALTRDEELRVAAQRAIDFIVAAQHKEGGWRYTPGSQGDTSVLGWQLMAMQSARSAELRVPVETWEMASIYLDSVQSREGSQYSYMPYRPPTHVMTAEALLCRMYLGWTKDYAPMIEGVRHLARNHMPRDDGTNFYYWYYATQVMHHFGGRHWKAWNLTMRDVLVETQSKRGHEAGSWQPRGGHAHQGGRLYATALAICTLEVYYRHAPIFRQLAIE